MLCQQLVARGGRAVGDDGVSGEEKGLGCHQPGQPLHKQVILMLDLVANRAVPIERSERVEAELVQGRGHRQGKNEHREPYNRWDLYDLWDLQVHTTETLLSRPLAASPIRRFA